MPDAHDLPPELDSFLSEHNRTFLMTVRKDGSPTMHPMTRHLRRRTSLL